MRLINVSSVTIQIVLENDLLREADRVARAAEMNRSQLMREALREHLRRLEIRAKEAQDRAGYEKRPDHADDVKRWQRVAAWPDE
jgi:metal-responsive CopG/Arc/MetJ family transcriptional regulator